MEMDSQFVAEGVSFLDCFNASFTAACPLNAVKDFCDEQLKISQSQTAKVKRKPLSLSQNDTALDSSGYCLPSNGISHKALINWGLPTEIVHNYAKRGVVEMFDWQVACLKNSKVLMDCSNMVYSAPTSAGKTLVAEILLIKTVLERQKKVIVILPFVSIVREKMVYLNDILSSSGIRVEGFMGSQAPPGGFQAVHVAVCTIEKANSLINRLLDDGEICELGAVIVDELHLLGDPHRGYILELLLTKIKYVSAMSEGVNIQIIGMSATLPNLETLSKWLDAELFVTQFRPIPLEEYCLVSDQLYNKNGELATIVNASDSNNDHVLQICCDTIKDGCSVLIFCMTKNWCENLAKAISVSFYRLGNSNSALGITLREQLKADAIMEVLEQLKTCSVGLDQVLKSTVSFGVAYHHAGLTFDERDIIEGGFKSGAIRVLVATSTLSSGVNLPARKVIIRSPVFQKQPLNILTYKQMAGRAGRMGSDSMGESILISTEAEKKIAFGLMMGCLDPVMSCIDREDKYMRAILEVIASQVACTRSQLEMYSKCTLQFHQCDPVGPEQLLLVDSLKELEKFELIRVQNDENDVKYIATPLGKACLSSSMAPNDGLSLFCELQKARQCIVLETDLHLIYLVTPYSVSGQWANIDWLHFLNLWETSSKAVKKVGELVGVREGFLVRCVQGAKLNMSDNKLYIHKRFYTALALQDLVNEIPLSEVANKFQCPRGFLQSLQQGAATFAGMVTSFCHQLAWKNMEMLFSQFQDRLQFGIHSELLELMRLPSLNGMRARSLFNAGFETVSSIALASINKLENALLLAVPFQSEKEREGESEEDAKKRNKMKNIWVTGHCGMTTKQAAENLINEARIFLQREIGVDGIKWKNELLSEDRRKSEDIIEDNEAILFPSVLIDNDSFINVKGGNITSKAKENSVTLALLDGTTKVVYEQTKINNDDTLKPRKNGTSQAISDVTANEIFEETLITMDTTRRLKNEKSKWDTLIYSETVLRDITQPSTPSHLTSNPCADSKDVSIFSHEDSDCSMFEDSLPLELIPSKLLDNNQSFRNNKLKQESVSSISDGEDFTLYYEKDSDNEIIDATITSSLEPYARKRHIVETIDGVETLERYILPSNNGNVQELTMKCPGSRSFFISYEDNNIKCFYLTDDDIVDFLCTLNGARKYSLHFDVRVRFNSFIGSRIIHGKERERGQCDLGIALFDGEHSIYFILNWAQGNKVKRQFTRFLASCRGHIRVMSYVNTLILFRRYLSVTPEDNILDISLLEWLITSSVMADLEEVVQKYLDINMAQMHIKELPSRCYENFTSIEKTCTTTWAIYKIYDKQFNILSHRHNKPMKMIETEMAVAKILHNLSYNGVIGDRRLCKDLYKDIVETKKLVHERAVQIYGTRFNMESRKAIAKVLGISEKRRVSTKKSVLSAMQSPLADAIMLWRKLDSIEHKILYPLNRCATYEKNEKIPWKMFPVFTMHTGTGRVCMREPSLQHMPRTFSIPVKFFNPESDTNEVNEFNIRSILAAKKNHVLVGADYCQLEMRILAHFSEDDALLDIMNSDGDIFKSIAATWSNVPEEEVHDELRQRTKQICYGIIYGMGAKTLGNELNISELEAKDLMASFHSAFPGIEACKSKIVEFCREKGYVRTLMDRRRYIRDMDHRRPMFRMAAERKAFNTVIQGSAADIVKLVMIKASKFYGGGGLLMQLHDELIYQVPSTHKFSFAYSLKQAMEKTTKLLVPLPVSVKVGSAWGTMEKIEVAEAFKDLK